MKLIDRQYLETPFYGVERMTGWLKSQGYSVNVKRIRRLMRLMNLTALGPKPSLSQTHPDHRKYPYLLDNHEITAINQVWSTDITYIPMPRGFLYLTAVMDWHSRYVLSWELSNTLETGFCLTALQNALKQGKPAIFNTDQGVQYTSREFTGYLEANGIQISMDGKGRATDNAFVERLWRSVKYECVYLHAFETGNDLYQGLKQYFDFYNRLRVHQSLRYQTPYAVHFLRPHSNS